MYGSYSCSGSSNNDQLPCSGSRCFYLDSCTYYRSDHFYPWKSFPCCFARSLYVWSRGLILRTYQEFLIIFCILFFAFPAFAEDEAYIFQNLGYESMAVNGEDVIAYMENVNFERRNDEVSSILSEPLRSSYVNNNVRLDIDRVDDTLFHYTSTFLGDSSAGTFLRNVIQLNVNNSYVSLYDTYNRVWDNPFSGYIDLSSYPEDSFYYLISSYSFRNIDTNRTFYVNSNFVYSDQLYSEPVITDTFGFFESVQEVFTWILNHISEIITFILGNAFLSVSLLLFLSGAVISFFVRVKRS